MEPQTNNIQETLAALIFKPDIFNKLVISAILVVILILARSITLKHINSWDSVTVESRRKWIVTVRNVSVFAAIVGLIFIWGYQIKEFALSVAAITIAFVMCFKEVIANLMGGLSRAISHQFNIGDRISVAQHRGDVIDTDTFTTTILEIGPGLTSHQYTGSTITFPNSMLLTNAVVNESFMQDFLLHVFHVPLNRRDGWERNERLLLLAANIVCEPYLADAKKFMEKISKKISVDTPSAAPRVSIILTKPDELDLVMRVPVPSRRKGKIEQEIIRKYLQLLDENPA